MSNGAEHLRLVELPPAPEPPPDPLVGKTVDGRYKFDGVLGQGGMGVVYAATHVVLGKKLAIKVLKPDVSKDQEIMARFRQEAQSASAIGSQHIIDISDFGQLADGSTYFVMEFLDGRELTKVIEQDRPIAPERVVHVAKQLCDALGAAHERGIVHRDMKPDNIFLVKRGSNKDFVKVLDFGIAKVGGASSKLTRAGQVFGTPHYMSPEQCSGQAVDHRTDIYALGVILYELACGKVPFDADNLMGILTKHIYEQPIPPHQLPPPVNVPAGLEAVILKCLAKQADTRYQTMAEVRADLEAFERGQTPSAVMDAVERRSGPMAGGTGSHAAMQMGVGGTAPEEKKSKTGLIVGLLAALLFLGGAGAVAGYFLVFAAAGPEEGTTAEVTTPPPEVEEPVVEEPEVEEPVAEAQPETPPTPPPPPPIQVVSEPAGVEVWTSDGALLGNTPFAIPRPARGERVVVTLKQPGFEDHEVRLSHLTQAEVRVTLVRRRESSGRRRPEAVTVANPTPPQQQPTPPPPRRGVANSEVLDPWAR